MKFSLLFSILILGLIHPAIAASSPRYIYHVPSVMPTEIFDRGFDMNGQDIDLLRYISGQSVLIGTTSFFPAMDLLTVALRIARQAILKHRAIPLWVYVIRPTGEVYNVTKSLHSS